MFWVDRGQPSCVLLTSLHHLQMSLSLWFSCWYALQSSTRTVAHGTSDNGRAFLLFFRQGTSMHCPKVLSCLSRCLWCQVLTDTTNWHGTLLLTSAWESNFTGKIRSIEGTEKSTNILQCGRLSISYQAWSISRLGLSHSFQKCNRNSGSLFLIYTHCWELMKSVSSHGSFITATSDEGTLWWSDTLWVISWGYDDTHCHVIFKVLL